jgi:hypothetical protein
MPLPILLNLSFMYLLLCGVAGFLGRHRRIGFWGFFFLSIIVTPFLTAALIFFAAKAPRPSKRAVPRRG